MDGPYRWFSELFAQVADSCALPTYSITAQWWCTSLASSALLLVFVPVGLYLAVKLVKATHMALSVPWLANKCRRLRKEHARLERKLGNARKIADAVESIDLGKK